MPFKAGRINSFLSEWKTITTDVNILDIVKGCKIEFNRGPPFQLRVPRSLKISYRESEFIKTEVSRLLEKGVIIPTQHEKGEFLSSIFVTPKNDGSYRLILNLKSFNKHIAYHHFKMESLHYVIQIMKKDCYMASVDLRDAYYSVRIHENYQKYLKFSFNNQLFQFTCLPNGLACAPRLFTKLLKPVYCTLRSRGFLSVAYIDDSYLQGNSYDDCLNNVKATVDLFTKLGFIVHPDKSVMTPTQELKFLGFILNSKTMSVSLTPERISSLKEIIHKLLATKHPSIRDLAKVIGKLVAAFPGCLYGPLHYRCLEQNKVSALQKARGDFDASITLTNIAKQELDWWIQNIATANKPISQTHPNVVIETDASHLGWGAVCEGESCGGRWTHEETQQHINFLEMQAAFFAIKAFCTKRYYSHIRLIIDNTTAVCYINNMGGSHSIVCNDLAREIWDWCIHRRFWLSAAHLPGINNVAADKASRVFHDNTEWMLNREIFGNITKELFIPQIDLFASRINNQLDKYVSWKPDPGAHAVDAFSLDWSTNLFYAFPPFSLLGRVVQKLEADQAEGIVIVPNWPSQPWFPKVMSLAVTAPLILPKGKNTLKLPYDLEKIHPLYPKLVLLACHLSGLPCRKKAFQKIHSKSSCHHGGNQLINNMQDICISGKGFAVEDKLICFHQL